MQRLTARILLLFALIGTFLPIALAATTNAPHACCLRKSVHQCHGSAPASSEHLALRDAGCCNHDCCHAVTTAQWARLQPSATPAFAHNLIGSVAVPHSTLPHSTFSTSQSTRAPPHAAIA